MGSESTSFNRAVVFGAGALGSLIGGKLSRRLPVVLVTRGAHLAALREGGLRLGGLSDELLPLSDKLMAIERLDDLTGLLKQDDVLILTVKTLQVCEAAAAIRSALAKGDVSHFSVLSLQNGTGFEDDLRKELGPLANAQLGVAFAGATLRAPGVVDDWGGELLLPPGFRFEALAAEWSVAGQPAVAVGDVEPQRWQKILLNCALNVFSVFLDSRNNETVRPEWRPLRRAILREGRALAATRNVSVPDENELLESLEARALTSRNVNSMLQDIRRGRPTEIEYLNGAVARLASLRGGNAPANATVAEWIRRFERTDVAGHPALRTKAVRELLSCYA